MLTIMMLDQIMFMLISRRMVGLIHENYVDYNQAEDAVEERFCGWNKYFNGDQFGGENYATYCVLAGGSFSAVKG